MLDIYRTDDAVIHEAEEYEPGCWIKLTAPTTDECEQVANDYGMDIDDVRAALDEEESSRISVEDDYTLSKCDLSSLSIIGITREFIEMENLKVPPQAH